MARELVQARADADTVEGVEEYAEERDISRSEAIRRLLRAGLEVEEQADDVEGGRGVVIDEEGRLVVTTSREAVDGDGYATASINEIARIIAGGLIGAAILFVFLSQAGLI